MSLDIWFAEDIRNALLAANEASAQTAVMISNLSQVVNGECPGCSLADDLRAYREGYRAALATIALVFGIAPREIFSHQSKMREENNELLDHQILLE